MLMRRVEKIIGMPTEAKNIIAKPEKEISLALNIRVSEEKIIQSNAYLCIYNTVRGPAKGGIRFHPEVSLIETRKLAELMVWKTALVGIPFGGGKTGVAVDPHSLNRTEKTTVIKELVHLLKNELLSGDYIPAPDMGTDSRDMATIFGETHLLESVTGKPPRVGGLPGREEATGRGVAEVTRLLAKQYDLSPEKTTVAIQGFGNVGSWSAYFLSEQGFKIVAVSDLSGARFKGDGLDIGKLKQHFARNGGVLKGADEGEEIDRDSLLELDVDILIPAACGGVITMGNVRGVKARYIVEAANAPITEDAEEVLLEEGKVIIPDILANAGGVIASYVEWRKARSGSLTPKEETYRVIDSVIGSAYREVVEISRLYDVDYRVGAYVKAVNEVVLTMRDRGWL